MNTMTRTFTQQAHSGYKPQMIAAVWYYDGRDERFNPITHEPFVGVS